MHVTCLGVLLTIASTCCVIECMSDEQLSPCLKSWPGRNHEAAAGTHLLQSLASDPVLSRQHRALTSDPHRHLLSGVRAGTCIY